MFILYMCMCIYVCVYVHMHIYLYTYLYIFVYMHICFIHFYCAFGLRGIHYYFHYSSLNASAVFTTTLAILRLHCPFSYILTNLRVKNVYFLISQLDQSRSPLRILIQSFGITTNVYFNHNIILK